MSTDFHAHTEGKVVIMDKVPDTNSLMELYLPLYDMIKELSSLSKEEIQERNRQIDKDINRKMAAHFGTEDLSYEIKQRLINNMKEYSESLKTRFEEMDKEISATEQVSVIRVSSEAYSKIYKLFESSQNELVESKKKYDREYDTPDEEKDYQQFIHGQCSAYATALQMMGRYGLGISPRCSKDHLMTPDKAQELYEKITSNMDSIRRTGPLKYKEGINTAYEIVMRETGLDRFAEKENKPELDNKDLVEIAKEAFELEALFIGSLSGGIEPPPTTDSVTKNEDGTVSISYHLPETCGLSDCRYHNLDTAEHTVVYSLSEDGSRLFRDGGEAFPSITGWGDPEYSREAAEFYKKWHLEIPEEIVRDIDNVENEEDWER